jgi:hypothetical protein
VKVRVVLAPPASAPMVQVTPLVVVQVLLVAVIGLGRVAWMGLEAADLLFEQFGRSQRGAVLEHRTDELHSHRQALGGPARWYGGGGQAGHGGQTGPDELVEVRVLDAVDVDPACPRTGVVVVRESGSGCDRTHHGVELCEELPPTVAVELTTVVRLDPVAVAEHHAAQPRRIQTLVVRAQSGGAGPHLLVRLDGKMCSGARVRPSEGSTP